MCHSICAERVPYLAEIHVFFGRQIYVYPTLDATTGELVTADNLKVDPAVQLLYNYILQRGTLISIKEYNECVRN